MFIEVFFTKKTYEFNSYSNVHKSKNTLYVGIYYKYEMTDDYEYN